MPSGQIEWDRVRQWTDDIVADRIDGIRTCFLDNGVAAPAVSWSPQPDHCPCEPLRMLLHHWLSLSRGERIPHHGEIRPEQLRPALGFINIIEAIPRSHDLRYRLFGSIVARVSGFDMTGKLLSQHPSSAYVVEFTLASSLACLHRRQPLLTERQPAGAETVYRWPRLTVPLADDHGQVSRGLVVTAALDHGGNVVR